MEGQDQITYIGKVDHRNLMTKFGIKAKDRTKHMYIIGKTGTGKSTFLENMIVQDIQNGNGLAFVDPHGESARKLLDYIPEWRLNDVIYFDPSDFEFPIAFNPLEDPGPDKRHLVADGLMSVFKKVWPDAFSGRMEYILNTTMMSLLEYPDSTILSINRMLTDKDFRKRVVASVTDSAVKNAWEELMKWDDKRWSEAIAALINKVGQFSTNPVIRNIVGQPKSTFDFRKAMDERKIIIINLSKGMIGEQNAPLLGAMLITKIYLAAMSRAEMPQNVLKQAAPFYFYVDEFQNFANESFASILSEARKYKLCLTVANQYIAQMEETIRDAVFGNMGTTAAFRVGTLDAEFMEKVFAPVFTQEDLQNIAFGQFYLTLQIDGMGSKPFSAQGLGPIPPLEISQREKVIEMSRKNFARPREAVEEAVKEFFGYTKASAKVISSQQVGGQDTRNKSGDSNRSYSPQQGQGARVPQSDQKFSVSPRTERPMVQPQNNFSSDHKKPLPPIAGFKKPAGAQKPVGKVSDTLGGLLDKLDDAVVAEDVNGKAQEEKTTILEKNEKRSEQSVRPLVIAPRIPVPEKKPEEITPPKAPVVPKTAPVVASKELPRAASPEKKNALAEALARAMGKTEVANGEVEASHHSKRTDESLQSKPRVPHHDHEVGFQAIQDLEKKQGGDRVTAQEKPPVAPLRAHTENPVTPPPTPPSSLKSSGTIREVPEDILRKVLE